MENIDFKQRSWELFERVRELEKKNQQQQETINTLTKRLGNTEYAFGDMREEYDEILKHYEWELLKNKSLTRKRDNVAKELAEVKRENKEYKNWLLDCNCKK